MAEGVLSGLQHSLPFPCCESVHVEPHAPEHSGSCLASCFDPKSGELFFHIGRLAVFSVEKPVVFPRSGFGGSLLAVSCDPQHFRSSSLVYSDPLFAEAAVSFS